MIIPQKLQPWDEIRVIAPAISLSLLSQETIRLATQNLEKQGYKISFWKNTKEIDALLSSSVASRVSDILDAFQDSQVKGILTVIGGFNSNQLLRYLDFETIKNNPKILCGFSDITALANAITAKTGLITYSWPHFSTWAMEKESNYNREYFLKCCADHAPFEIQSSPTWSDDAWFRDQDNRNIETNTPMIGVNLWEAQGIIYGWNLCTLNLLQGTEFMPDLTDSILFLEDDDMTGNLFDVEFDRNLQSLIHQPNFDRVRGLVIGRFQRKSLMTQEKLDFILSSKPELAHIPIIVNADFGHTNPLFTFPIWWIAKMSVQANQVRLEILEH